MSFLGRRASRHQKDPAAFTLVELLVVIAIIGVLVALLLPAVQAAREAARRMQCTNNLKQVALGLLNYENAKGELPGGTSYEERSVAVNDRKDWRRWVVSVLPYMEQGNIAQQIDPEEPFRAGTKTTPGAIRNTEIAAKTVIATLICPSDTLAASPILEDWKPSGDNPAICQGLWYKGSMGPTVPDKCEWLLPNPVDTAAVCMGSNYGSDFPTPSPDFMAPCFKPNARPACPDPSVCVGMICRTKVGTQLKRVTDGLSNTFLIGETLPAHSMYSCTFCENFNVGSTHIPLNNWDDERGVPAALHNRAAGFKSMHPSGVHFAMSDGSVHFIPEATDYFVVNALGTRAAGETAQLTQ